MRIRLFCDIDIPDFDDQGHAPEGHPKDWDWKEILSLLGNEKIWVYGAEIQHDPVDTTENPAIIQATPTGDQS